MTVVHINLRKPINGGKSATTGDLVWRPTARRHVNGSGPAPDPNDFIVLPDDVVVTLSEGVATVEVDPAPEGGPWAWKVREKTDPRGTTRTVFVPDVDHIDYGDLVDVDPETLAPPAAPEAAWWAALAQVAATVPDDEDIAAAVDAYLAENPPAGGGGTVEMRTDGGFIQYRNAPDGAWQNVVALEDLRGPQGYPVMMRAATTYIQWRVNDGSPTGIWTNLLPIADLVGPPGDDGGPGPANTLSIGTVTTGAPGSAAEATIAGDAPAQTLSLTIPRGADGDPGDPGAPGGPGPSTEWRSTATHLQSRPVGGTTWTDVVALSAITGPPGEDGPPGATTIDGIAGLRDELDALQAAITALGSPLVPITAAEYEAIKPGTPGTVYVVKG